MLSNHPLGVLVMLLAVLALLVLLLVLASELRPPDDPKGRGR